MDKKIDTKYLKLRGNIWWFQRRIPKHLKPHYPNQTFIQMSLETADIREARRKRNVIIGQLESKTHDISSKSKGQQFRETVAQFERSKQADEYDWDIGVYPEILIEQNREVELEAYMTVNGKRDFSFKYRIRLSEVFDRWKNDWGLHKTEDTIQKVEKAVTDFGEYCHNSTDLYDCYDLALEDIRRQDVYSYIKHLEVTYKKTTVQAKISRLKVLWEFAESIGEVNSTNPFKGHRYSSAEHHQSNKRESFTRDEMKIIRNHQWEKPLYNLLVELGIYTGCRISELCNLKKKHVVEDEGIVAINIEKGKTKAATRTVPLPDGISKQLLEHVKNKQDDDLVIGVSSKTASRTFSNFKTKYVTANNLKGFHSFRHMYITAMERAGIDENIAAQIAGHERGKTMSYGYYSKGHELRRLKEAVDKAEEYLVAN